MSPDASSTSSRPTSRPSSPEAVRRQPKQPAPGAPAAPAPALPQAADSIDLLGTAGAPVLKRALPAVLGSRGHHRNHLAHRATQALIERSPRMQTPAQVDYARATSVDHALQLLAQHGEEARIIAGGHSLIPMMRLRLASPEVLIDINDLDELKRHPRSRATRS